VRARVAERVLAGRPVPRRAARRPRTALPRLRRRERGAPDHIALLAQPLAKVVDPAPGALGLRARGPGDLVDVDLGQALDGSVDLLGQRPRDVLEAVAIVVVSHGPMIAGGGPDLRRITPPGRRFHPLGILAVDAPERDRSRMLTPTVTYIGPAHTVRPSAPRPR
jgi:hypothetical protein